MKRNKRSTNGGGSGAGKGVLSQLGEELLKKFPAMVEESAKHRESDKLGTVLRDLNRELPYDWKDSEPFSQALELCVRGCHTQAEEVLADLISQEPEAYPAHKMLGLSYGARGDYKKEVEHYRKAIKIKTDSPQLYCSLGLAYWLLGKNNKAFAAFREAAARKPEFALVENWLSLVFDRLGRFKAPVELNEQERRDKSRCLAHTCYMLGIAYLEFGSHVAARHAFKKAVRIKPDFARAYYQLGALHTKKLRNPGRAAKFLSKAELLFVKQNDLQKASLAHQLYCSKDDVQEQDKAAEDWLKEGLRLQRIGRYQGAVDACRMALVFKKDFLDAYYNLGIAYGCMVDAGLDKLNSAIGAFKQAIGIKPDFVHAYIALGASYIKNGNYAEAKSVLEEVVDLDPKNSNVYYYLGTAFRLTGNLEEAVMNMTRAKNLNPDSVQIQFSLGLVHLDCERYQDAGEAFEEAVRLKPDFADAHFMLGNLYQTPLTDPEQSRAHLKKAEKLYAKLEDHQQTARVRQILLQQSLG